MKYVVPKTATWNSMFSPVLYHEELMLKMRSKSDFDSVKDHGTIFDGGGGVNYQLHMEKLQGLGYNKIQTMYSKFSKDWALPYKIK